ncbi:thiamine-phosphate kinase [bacterium]|nr:MAG: thiamine-phosphate kinase [bacterium]RIK61494.1 MAG: thiamine-phosphate kinase [Planctomycetota bacterium]
MSHAPDTDDEFAYIKWLRSELPPQTPRLELGPGDDAAILRVEQKERLVLKTDSVLEGQHFILKAPGVHLKEVQGPAATPEEVGRKALCRCLSDIAAMGGVPIACMAAVALPRGAGVKLREQIFLGLSKACATYGVSLAGGDTQSWNGPLMLNVSLIGEMQGERPAIRGGAAAGDVIAVTGSLGGSILGHHLRFEPRLTEGRFLVRHGVSAMIDISDGLSGDLARICEESSRRYEVGADIAAEALPVSKAARRLAKLEGQGGERALEHALHDGEDFELLFTAPAFRWQRIVREWPFDTPVRALGVVRERKKGEPAIRLLRKGEAQELALKSYVHKL